MWSTYQELAEPEIVARGLALGLIATKAVPDQLRMKLEHFLNISTGQCDERQALQLKS